MNTVASRMRRRRFVQACVVGAAGVSTLARRSDAASNTVRLGYLYPNLTTLIHGVARSSGAYDKHEVTVLDQRFSSGQTIEGVQQLWQGDLDLYFGGGPEVVNLNSRVIESGGKPPLAVVSGANAGHTSFVLGAKLQPASFDELVGKPLRIAVSSPSSDHLALFRGWLRVDKKLTEQELGWQFLPLEGADMPTALLTDQIDGFLHSEPTTTIALATHAGHLFMSARNGDFGPASPPMTFVMARRAFLMEHPDAVRAFMAAIFDANAYYAGAAKAQMIPIISQWSGTKPALLDLAYSRINPEMSMTRAQAEKWWNYVGLSMVASGQVSKQVQPFSDVFELQYQPLPPA
jgi:ABC-type nitrate/sulfonate/bicarbonate transport system substrate-binding protein